MFRTLAVVVLIPPAIVAQEPAAAPVPAAQEVRSVEDLIRFVEARERAVQAVTMSIETKGEFPDGSPFSTSGTLRVLGATHFEQRMTAQLGSGMEFETETVRTPDGVWMREKDPIQGEVFLRMDAATMARVEAASAALDEDPAIGLDGRAESPLGSAMLRDLARQFQLELSGPKVIERSECWVLAGPVRGGDETADDVLGTGADRVDIVVRVADGAILAMTQFTEGRPMIQIRIRDLVLDPLLKPESFVLSVPPRSEPVDVMDHPPTQAQLQALFERAIEKGWQDPAASTADESSKEGAPEDRGQAPQDASDQPR